MRLFLQRCGLVRSRLAHSAYFFKLTQSRLCGRFDLGECLLEIVRLFFAYPKVTVGNIAAGAHEFDIKTGEGVVLCQQGEHTSALSHGADDFSVADLAEKGLGCLGLADIGGEKRRAPDLNDVVLAWLCVGVKEDEFARGEEAEAMAWLRRGDALRDEIVAKKQVGAALEMREYKQRVFTIRSRDALLETHRW